MSRIILLIASLLCSASHAQDGPAQPQQQAAQQSVEVELNNDQSFALLCKAEADLTEDLTAILLDPTVQQQREDFQNFFFNPGGVLQAITEGLHSPAQRPAIQAEVIARLLSNQRSVNMLNAQVAKLRQQPEYATADIKVIQEVVTAQQVDLHIARQVRTQAYEATIMGCNMYLSLKDQITENGCKTAEGVDIDLTDVIAFCDTIKGPMNGIVEAGEGVETVRNSINEKNAPFISQIAELQAQIDANIAAGKEAEAPHLESVATNTTEIMKVLDPYITPESVGDDGDGTSLDDLN